MPFILMQFVLQEQIPLNSEDFKLHSQKKIHKEKEIELKSSRQKNGSDIVQGGSIQKSKSNTELNVQIDQAIKLKAAISTSSLNYNGNASVSQINSQKMVNRTAVHPNLLKLENVIKTDDVSVENAIVAEMIDFVSRTDRRVQNEAIILKTLAQHLKGIYSALKFVPFGSSTYGFGGSKTNLNILVNAGNHKLQLLIDRLLYNVKGYCFSVRDFIVPFFQF